MHDDTTWEMGSLSPDVMYVCKVCTPNCMYMYI